MGNNRHNLKRIFVSGCYDIIHAGHLQFFEEARALGDHLTVSFASENVLWEHKKRRPAIPDAHKKALLEGFSIVDEVIVGADEGHGLDFRSYFLEAKPDMLVVTEDDQYGDLKRELCAQVGAVYHVLPKTPPKFKPVSSSGIVKWVKAPTHSPLRVDFAGGWLDVPRYARDGAYVVNCTISPLVSLKDWQYETRSGLGGSGAWALLNGENGVHDELELGVGWQDPAVIHETGLCVWQSGALPKLDFKRNGDMLKGHLAIYWTGRQHDTPTYAEKQRDYDLIMRASLLAREAIITQDLAQLGQAIDLSYQAQLDEGMDVLPVIEGVSGRKYCGGGHGGYALYLFESESDRETALDNHKQLRAIEPYIS